MVTVRASTLPTPLPGGKLRAGYLLAYDQDNRLTGWSTYANAIKTTCAYAEGVALHSSVASDYLWIAWRCGPCERNELNLRRPIRLNSPRTVSRPC